MQHVQNANKQIVLVKRKDCSKKNAILAKQMMIADAKQVLLLPVLNQNR